MLGDGPGGGGGPGGAGGCAPPPLANTARVPGREACPDELNSGPGLLPQTSCPDSQGPYLL
eukprot:7443389-Lingulodinium_polyedra.AAC.1